jgi:hypothetical protein
MKQSTYTLKLFCLLALSLIFSCQKPEPDPSDYVQPTDPYHTLPEITQEGKNTFGCLVNGVVWVPRVELFVPWYTLDFQFSEKSPKAIGNISCRILSTSQDEFMTIVFGPTFLKTGVYDMSFKNNTDMDLRNKNKDYSAWKRDSLLNFVKVNYINTDLNIVSGQFQFKLFNDANPKDSITVTDGRFDLQY